MRATRSGLQDLIRQAPLTVATSLLMLSGAVANTPLVPLLNSERIQEKYGSYGVEILTQSGICRVSSLYSIDGDSRITRTLAIVAFSPSVPPRLESAHEDIIAGASLGARLKKDGWLIRKRPVWLGELPATASRGWLQQRMNLEHPAGLAVLIYQLGVVRQESELEYATIMEIHHPDYLDTEALAALKPSAPRQPDSRPDLSIISALLNGSPPEHAANSFNSCDVGLTVPAQL